MRALLLTIGLIGMLSGIGMLTNTSARYEDPPCLAPDTWFPKTPPVADDFKVPNEDDECNFYKWGWQSFLWLTQSDAEGQSPRFLSFKNPNDLFPGPQGKKLQLVASPSNTSGGKRVLALSVRTLPSGGVGSISTIAIEQAGSHGVVVDRNNRSIYYGMHLNDAFVTFVTKKLGLTSPDKIKDVPLKTEFPPGCLELKSSWRVLTDEEKKPESRKVLEETFFITEATVPTLFVDKNDKNRIKADPSKPLPETVALVGLHVVGTIVGHPEFIWASFEHVKNVPILTNQALPGAKPVDANNDYTFYRKGTLLRSSNKNPVGTAVNPLTLTSQEKQTLTPIVDIFRRFDSGENGVGEDVQIQSLNKDVKSKLKGNLSVWANYKLIGAVWHKKPAASFKENSEFNDDAILAGETKLSNSTMETFTQQTKPNCFRCHHTASETDMDTGKTIPGLRIKVSHVIRNAYLNSK